jgi:hypothetical protein
MVQVHSGFVAAHGTMGGSGASMTETGWTFEKLLRNGWYARWADPAPADTPHALEFVFYRSEHTVHIVRTHGDTEDAAIAQAVEGANQWLREHPQYQPRR